MIEFGFTAKALLMGIGLVFLTGPIGTLVVWRRMAYFGETLGHSTLLGATLAYTFAINIYIGLLGTCLASALFIFLLSRQKKLSIDSVLGLLAHAALATGLIVAAQTQNLRLDVLSFLQGNILAVTTTDLWLVLLAAVGVNACLYWAWPALIAIIVNEDLAKAEGRAVHGLNVFQVILLSIVFALAMKLVGVLLLTSLLIIPPVSARLLSRSPEQMVAWSIFLGGAAVVIGIFFSSYKDWPTGPAIVVAASIIFVVLMILGIFRDMIFSK